MWKKKRCTAKKQDFHQAALELGLIPVHNELQSFNIPKRSSKSKGWNCLVSTLILQQSSRDARTCEIRFGAVSIQNREFTCD